MAGKQSGIQTYISQPITRRQAIKAGGIAAVGFAFSKPALDECTDEQIPAAKKKLMTFHSLRHTTRSILRDLGFDAFAISAQVGHKTIEMAAHYASMRRLAKPRLWGSGRVGSQHSAGTRFQPLRGW